MAANEGSFSEICVDPQPAGVRAVYLVETRDPQEAREVAKLFRDMESRVQVRQLCTGKLVSYAIQLHESDSSLLDEIENTLKGHYSFVVTQRSFDELIYRIVRELCADTGSRLLPVSHCNICGRTTPFPSVLISLFDHQGRAKTCRGYCASCTAGATATSHKEFVRSLLALDKRKFRSIERAELVRRPSRKQPIRFKVKDNV